ncbi:MAG TPA: rhomboid family intramembrane serine protease [Spirochaetota bacterium]|nr:rhomboid family intramembrane serine protease [Spirochaetota bacterium]HOL56053.1 rhomboid family intramembrane serine protease [Spirochaetota bacterium]HPP03199.1 rhomboid family intramembrane serine protease [Spirochaetota bacterium]
MNMDRYKFGVTETIILINFIFFIPYILSFITASPFFYNLSIYYLGLNINSPYGFLSINNGAIWQVLTAMFMHGGLGHIIFNMYGLYIFGKPLELRWGGARFLSFYLTTGILANIASVIVYIFSKNSITLIGASGAVYAVLLAFGAYYPDVKLLLFFFIPIKVKWAILLFTVLSLFFQFSNIANFIGHLTHLFGFLFSFLYLLIFFRINAIKKMFFSKDDYIIY